MQSGRQCVARSVALKIRLEECSPGIRREPIWFSPPAALRYDSDFRLIYEPPGLRLRVVNVVCVAESELPASEGLSTIQVSFIP